MCFAHGISITAPALFYLPPSLAVACLFSNRIRAARFTFYQQQQKVNKKCRSQLKFLTAQKAYFRAPTALSFQMYPSNFHSNGIPRGVHLPFPPKTNLLVLKL
jgi:hypothetical protein